MIREINDNLVTAAAVLETTLLDSKTEFKNGTVQVKMRPGDFNLLLHLLEVIHDMDANELDEYMAEFRRTH